MSENQDVFYTVEMEKPPPVDNKALFKRIKSKVVKITTAVTATTCGRITTLLFSAIVGMVIYISIHYTGKPFYYKTCII
jgi:hypothetical protein